MICFAVGIAMFGIGCTRTVVGTYRSDSPDNQFHLAIRTAGPYGRPFAEENKKDVRAVFFTGDPERSAGGATLKVIATAPSYQAQWEGNKRIVIDVVEGEPGKANRKLATAVFIYDEGRKRFKLE